MKVLVTGAAGFIGSNTCEYLLNSGYEVVGLDNFNDYYNPKLKEYNIKDFVDNKHFKLYRIDLLDLNALEELFMEGKPDAIIHLAAWAGVTRSIKEPVMYVRNNIEATVNLADLAVKYKVGNFIFASTSSIYGDNETPFTESMVTDNPLAPYPATKKACEVMLSTYQRNFGLNTTVFRIFNPLGPRQRPDLALTLLIRSCLYGSEFHQYQNADDTGRDYTYVGHLLDAMNTVLKNPYPYEIFNMGNSSPVRLGDYIKIVEDVVGKKANIIRGDKRMGEMQITYANIDKAKRMLNYNPTTTVAESVKIYYDWFVQQEDWYKEGNY